MKIYYSWVGLAALLIIVVLLAPVAGQTPDDDEVILPIPGYNHKFFSGYFILSFLQKPRIVHYVFYHSQNDINKDPLVVWFTGGPGCSSLLAAFHENGPFVFSPGSHLLTLNQNSWNKKANLLYLELPLNVGFSEGPEEEVITDQTFAQTAMGSLRNFFARFPGMKKNQLYLTGHGYAGVYVTYLAKLIVEENNDPDVIYNDNFNLKGILVGNPCVRPDECYASGSEKHSYYHYQFLYNRAFINKQRWNQFRGTCILNYDGFDCYQKRVDLDKFFNTTNSSMYNIYDKCYKGLNGSNYINTGCQDDAALTEYLNDPHSRETWNIRGNKTWEACNKDVFAEYRNGNNSYWIYPFLIKNNLRIWVFSGDLDSYIPIIGTKRWISELRHELNMPIKRIWREWWVPGRHSGEDQVGGFIWQLRDLTFVTVKGAGFRAALDQPKAMAQILTGFLAGTTLPYKNQ